MASKRDLVLIKKMILYLRNIITYNYNITKKKLLSKTWNHQKK